MPNLCMLGAKRPAKDDTTTEKGFKNENVKEISPTYRRQASRETACQAQRPRYE